MRGFYSILQDNSPSFTRARQRYPWGTGRSAPIIYGRKNDDVTAEFNETRLNRHCFYARLVNPRQTSFGFFFSFFFVQPYKKSCFSTGRACCTGGRNKYAGGPTRPFYSNDYNIQAYVHTARFARAAADKCKAKTV